MKGDSTSQEAPIAHQRSGLLWRSLASSDFHRRLRRYFASAASLPGFLFSSATCVPSAVVRRAASPNRFGSALRLIPARQYNVPLYFPASPEHLSPGTRFPCKPPDPKEPLLRKQSVALAAVALIVSVGMASAQQRTPPQYDKSGAASDLQSKTRDRTSAATPLDQGNGNWDPPPVVGPTTQR